jgi:integrase
LRDRALDRCSHPPHAGSVSARLDRDDWNTHRQAVVGKGDRERVVTVTARLALRCGASPIATTVPALFVSYQAATRGRQENHFCAAGSRHVCRELPCIGIPPFRPHQLRHSWERCCRSVGDARLRGT